MSNRFFKKFDLLKDFSIFFLSILSTYIKTVSVITSVSWDDNITITCVPVSQLAKTDTLICCLEIHVCLYPIIAAVESINGESGLNLSKRRAASGNLIWGMGSIAAFNVGAVIDWRTMCAAVGLSTLTQFMSFPNHHLHDLTRHNRSEVQWLKLVICRRNL